MPTPAILLFVKLPRPGEAKTRLTPYLTPEAAADVAACLARDAAWYARRCLPPRGRLVLVYTPDNSWEDMQRVLAIRGFLAENVLPPIGLRQQGGDLGERMANAAKEAMELYDLGPLLLIGADCPMMPPEAITAAFQRLSADRENDPGADVVLGPAEDGGYYLLGLRSMDSVSPLLSGVDWSTERVFEQTVGNARRLGLRCDSNLPICYDIDMPADLGRLRQDLLSDSDLQERMPAIAEWLAKDTLPPFSVSPADGHR